MTCTQLSYACNFKCITKNKLNINFKREHGNPATLKYLSMRGYFKPMVIWCLMWVQWKRVLINHILCKTWKIWRENYFIYLQSIRRPISQKRLV
jgi:hypothetical protein